MSYASGQTFYDADSHLMELPDFLRAHADPELRDRMPRIHVDAPRLQQGLADAAVRGAQPPEQVRELLALGDKLIAGPKGYQALGAFNAAERSRALDMLGFARQLVFSTFSAGYAFSEQRTLQERYAIARAHNRAMTEFCAEDHRLFGVALLPLDDVALSIAELTQIQRERLRAVWIPHRPCGGRSPGHDELDPLWAQLAAAGIPFVLHVGGRPLQIDPRWMNTGRALPTDWLGGGENVRGKDMIALHHDAETFIGSLVLDRSAAAPSHAARWRDRARSGLGAVAARASRLDR
jgi:hypothetical protein